MSERKKNLKELFMEVFPDQTDSGIDAAAADYLKDIAEGKSNLQLWKLRELMKEAKRKKVCTYCGRKIVKKIMTKADKEEYEISGMCKPCMDIAFEEIEEHDLKETKGVKH